LKEDSPADIADKKIDLQELKSNENRYLTFYIGEKLMAIQVKYSIEIVRITKITSIPGTSKAVKGVMNLRGKVIPVMCLKERLGVEGEKDFHARTCVVVCRFNGIDIGFIVDRVDEVCDFDPFLIDDKIADSSEYGDEVQSIAKINENIIIILNLKNVLYCDDNRE
jgi:purine-binding chemotaxis protein CheW